MKYEFRVCKDQGNMPEVKAAAAKSKIAAIAGDIDAIINGADRGDPDILIDTNVLGEEAIKLTNINFSEQTIKVPGANQATEQKKYVQLQ